MIEDAFKEFSDKDVLNEPALDFSDLITAAPALGAAKETNDSKPLEILSK
ncbi:MAG: hypothetical protein IPM82_10035 [Saprospiraceae bacterium]|nr:hypothetical protein [Saprospiraceae bacterium]